MTKPSHQCSVLVRPILLALAAFALVNCTPRNDPRYVQEGKVEWKKTYAPSDDSVTDSSFTNYDLKGAYRLVADPKTDLTHQVLQPLAQFVLNAKFIEVPRYRTTRMTQMLHVFNQAFATRLKAHDASPEIAALKAKYIATMYSGCSRDLRHYCLNSDLFDSDSFAGVIVTYLATDYDAAIDRELQAVAAANVECGTRSPCRQAVKCVTRAPCREAVEARYGLLAFGVRRRNMNKDADFDFAYMKYARLMGDFLNYVRDPHNAVPADLSYSYLAETHGPIFESIIKHYHPSNTDPKSKEGQEFRKFVENFNPWTYSARTANAFQYGTEVMFELGAKCCLYADAGKTKLNKAVSDAIRDSQLPDPTGSTPTFVEMLEYIRKARMAPGADPKTVPAIFAKLGIDHMLAEIPGNDSAFYDEYFLVIDRLYHDHLNSEKVAMILHSANPLRAATELPLRIRQYVQVVMAYQVIKTSKSMARVLTTNVPSDDLFPFAQSSSRDFMDEWHRVQEKIDLLDQLRGSYFGQHATSKESEQTKALIDNLDRNVNLLAVFTNMIATSSYLVKLNGTRKFTSYWGEEFTITPDTTLKSFFAGNERPWFIFARNPEKPNRVMILFAFQYLLSMNMLQDLVDEMLVKDPHAVTNTPISVLNLIFQKFIGADIDVLQTKYDDYIHNTEGSNDSQKIRETCDYELGLSRFPREPILSLLDLKMFTYAGTGKSGVNAILNTYLTGLKEIVTSLNGDLEDREAMLRAMVDILADEDGFKGSERDKDPQLTVARDILRKISTLRAGTQTSFARSQDYFLKCAVRLREVEHRRANRLYDEEAVFLANIFDQMVKKNLWALRDAANDSTASAAQLAQRDADLAGAVQALNRELFPKGTSEFDHINKDLTFSMSEFDLLMRMRARVMRDTFLNGTGDPATDKWIADREARYYDSQVEYRKARPVTVFIPDKFRETQEMVLKATAKQIYMTGTGLNERSNFITQGLQRLNGAGATGAFTSWGSELYSDTTLADYLDVAEKMYLMLPPDGAKTQAAIGANDLANAFVTVYASYGLDGYDLEYAPVFKMPGRAEKAFFQNVLFDPDGFGHLPLFFGLMQSMLKLGQTNTDDQSGAAHDALDMKQTYSALFPDPQKSIFLFPPTDIIRRSVVEHYGSRINYRFAQVRRLFDNLQMKESDNAGARDLDPRLAKPFYIENGQPVAWYVEGQKNILDPIRFEDLNRYVNQFLQGTKMWDDTAQKTFNFYGTPEKALAK